MLKFHTLVHCGPNKTAGATSGGLKLQCVAIGIFSILVLTSVVDTTSSYFVESQLN